jgi:hypothetical protein
MPTFKILSHCDRDRGERYLIDGKEVAATNYEDEGSAGQEAAQRVFEGVANALGCPVEFEEVSEWPTT